MKHTTLMRIVALKQVMNLPHADNKLLEQQAEACLEEDMQGLILDFPDFAFEVVLGKLMRDWPRFVRAALEDNQ